MQSLAELDAMLESMTKEQVLKEAKESTREKKEYCIRNGSYVRVSDDGMSAWIYLVPPGEDEEIFSRGRIVLFIKQYGVLKGFHESNISAIAKKRVYEREILIAKGLDPKAGADGYYEYFFDTEVNKSPVIREDGTADYSAMSQLTNVSQGDLIAEYHPAVMPTPGYDVYGNPITLVNTKELPGLRGQGISNTKEKNKYYADKNGRIVFSDGHIDIKEFYDIYGDVDYITGKVEFFGDIHITGDVLPGVVIRASRNVIIDGVVEAAKVFAGGNITVKKGIKGKQHSFIAARGDVYADFIEYATVHAGCNVRSNAFLDSEVYAGEKVYAEGRRGIILGGNVRGLLGVEAMIIGNEAEIPTIVTSGYTEDDFAKYYSASQKENEVKHEISIIADRLSELIRDRRLGREVDSAKTDLILVELNEKKDFYFQELDKARTEKEDVELVIQKGKGSYINALDRIYKGVRVCIEGEILSIPSNTVTMKYRKEDGMVRGSVITYTGK